MIWLQMLPVLCVWLAWILWRRKPWSESRLRYAGIPRGKRVVLSVLASVMGPAILLAGLLLIDFSGGFQGNLTVPTLLSITVLGLGFMELQMAAVAITGSLVADGVTASRRPSSKMEEQEDEHK